MRTRTGRLRAPSQRSQRDSAILAAERSVRRTSQASEATPRPAIATRQACREFARHPPPSEPLRPRAPLPRAARGAIVGAAAREPTLALPEQARFAASGQHWPHENRSSRRRFVSPAIPVAARAPRTRDDDRPRSQVRCRTRRPAESPTRPSRCQRRCPRPASLHLRVEQQQGSREGIH